MKTLADDQCKNEIRERVGRAQADCQRRWGKMSAHQMVCHLADSFRGVMGQKSLAPRPMFGRGVIKWIALYAPFPWPHGVKTMPEMDQEIGGTQPAEFEADRRELLRLFEKFYAAAQGFCVEAPPYVLGGCPERRVDALGIICTRIIICGSSGCEDEVMR